MKEVIICKIDGYRFDSPHEASIVAKYLGHHPTEVNMENFTVWESAEQCIAHIKEMKDQIRIERIKSKIGDEDFQFLVENLKESKQKVEPISTNNGITINSTVRKVFKKKGRDNLMRIYNCISCSSNGIFENEDACSIATLFDMYERINKIGMRETRKWRNFGRQSESTLRIIAHQLGIKLLEYPEKSQ
jgi:hypothetical protein